MGRRVTLPALAMALVVVGVLPGLARARPPVNWTQFRFDQHHTGVQPFETDISVANAKFLGPAFQDQLGALVDGSSPAVVGGIAYIGSDDGVLWAYAADGCGQSLCRTPLWRSTNLAQIIDAPAVADGTVFVGSQTSFTSAAGKLDAFGAAGCGHAVCPPLWQGDAGSQSILESSPTVVGGAVFVAAFDGKLYAFAAKGCGAALCEPLWTGATGGHVESSPTVVNGVVYIGSDDGKLYAFPAKGCGARACAPLWIGPIGGPAYSSTAAVSNGTVFIGSDHYLAAFPAAGCGATTCKPMWRGTYPNSFLGGSPAVYNGHVYIGIEAMVGAFGADGCGQPLCQPQWLDFGSGEQASIQSSPTIANGVLFVGRNTGQVLAWGAAPCGRSVCDEIWSGQTGDPIVSSSPTVVNGKVYIGSANNLMPENIQGRIYVFALRI